MSYTSDDYIKDCLISNQGNSYKHEEAKIRAHYYEEGKLDWIYNNYPEYHGDENYQSIKEMYEGFCANIGGKTYNYDSLYQMNEYPIDSKLYELYSKLSDELKFWEIHSKKSDPFSQEAMKDCENEIINLEEEIKLELSKKYNV